MVKLLLKDVTTKWRCCNIVLIQQYFHTLSDLRYFQLTFWAKYNWGTVWLFFYRTMSPPGGQSDTLQSVKQTSVVFWIVDGLTMIKTIKKVIMAKGFFFQHFKFCFIYSKLKPVKYYTLLNKYTRKYWEEVGSLRIKGQQYYVYSVFEQHEELWWVLWYCSR